MTSFAPDLISAPPMLPQFSRRSLVAAGAAALSSPALSAMLANTTIAPVAEPPTNGSASKPDKAVPEASKHAGEPVSQTAAAQKGQPVIPGPPPRKTRFALVGLGKLMVDEILPAIRLSRCCEITALVTGHPDKGHALADALDLPRDRVFDYADIPRFEQDSTIDAVYIATPNAIHARDTIASLRAGKHVLCEKPMATTLADADAMISAAIEHKRKLMIAYRIHHEPINQAIRAMLQAKRYGKPHFVTFDALLDVGDKPQPRLSTELSGGGSLFDIGIYALNTTCWLLGETPVEVSAMQHNFPSDPRFDEVEENIAFHLRFPSGCIATCTSSYSTARVNRYRIICDSGWMGMDPATHYREIKGEHGSDEAHSLLTKPETVNQFAAEFDHFATCIRDNRPVESPGDEGRRDLDLMLKIYESARTRKSITV